MVAKRKKIKSKSLRKKNKLKYKRYIDQKSKENPLKPAYHKSLKLQPVMFQPKQLHYHNQNQL